MLYWLILLSSSEWVPSRKSSSSLRSNLNSANNTLSQANVAAANLSAQQTEECSPSFHSEKIEHGPFVRGYPLPEAVDLDQSGENNVHTNCKCYYNITEVDNQYVIRSKVYAEMAYLYSSVFIIVLVLCHFILLTLAHNTFWLIDIF